MVDKVKNIAIFPTSQVGSRDTLEICLLLNEGFRKLGIEVEEEPFLLVKLDDDWYYLHIFRAGADWIVDVSHGPEFRRGVPGLVAAWLQITRQWDNRVSEQAIHLVHQQLVHSLGLADLRWCYRKDGKF